MNMLLSLLMILCWNRFRRKCRKHIQAYRTRASFVSKDALVKIRSRYMKHNTFFLEKIEENK